MKKKLKTFLIAFLILLLGILCGFAAFYMGRIRTVRSIEQVTDNSGYELYRMDVQYNYDLDRLIARGITDNQSMLDAILAESLPLLPIHMTAPNYGCSAFTLTDSDHSVRMGRNYDFKIDTSSLLVHCTPENGYESVAFAALSNISANQLTSTSKKLAALTAPFICLDGMNEKGVSIAVLTLDSEPTYQQTGKPTIFTTLAIRLVLDRAATTQEAVDLLRSYDMFASSGRDYHFYITDASGDGRVIEYDCDDPARPLVDTRIDAITNFFGMYIDRVEPNQKNGIYGHGKERYDRMEEVFANRKNDAADDTAWNALKAAAQEPNPLDVTSNTQWSIVYNNTDLTVQFVLRRAWDQMIHYDLNTNTIA